MKEYTVTQICNMQPVRLEISSPYMERGTFIHDGIESEVLSGVPNLYKASEFVIYDLNLVDFKTETRTFKDYANFKISGKYDLLGKDLEGCQVLVDFKTGKKYNSHPIQLGGYAWLNNLTPDSKLWIFYEDQAEAKQFDVQECIELWFNQLEKFSKMLKSISE